MLRGGVRPPGRCPAGEGERGEGEGEGEEEEEEEENRGGGGVSNVRPAFAGVGPGWRGETSTRSRQARYTLIQGGHVQQDTGLAERASAGARACQVPRKRAAGRMGSHPTGAPVGGGRESLLHQ